MHRGGRVQRLRCKTHSKRFLQLWRQSYICSWRARERLPPLRPVFEALSSYSRARIAAETSFKTLISFYTGL